MRAAGISLALLIAVCGCDGGGNGDFAFAPVAAWPRFRHDANNTGQGFGLVDNNQGAVKWVQPVDEDGISAVSASPAIDVNGTVYVGSEGGTLRAFAPNDGSIAWTVASCPLCALAPLGPLTSSPAVFTLNTQTTVMVGSGSGALLVFSGPNGSAPQCAACFRVQSRVADFGPDTDVQSASVVSSPLFSTNVVTGTIAGIFFGAQAVIERDGVISTVGKLYAINSDGSLRWQFPRPGEPDIAPVTSSPSFGLGGAVYFTAGSTLYALSQNGTLKWKFELPAGSFDGLSVPFAPSPVSATFVYIGTRSGVVYALTPDGFFRWRTEVDDVGFESSLAVGIQAVPPATPTPTPGTEPTGTTTQTPDVTSTPTSTPTPPRFSTNVFGITENGTVVVLNSSDGTIVPLMQELPTPISGRVLSSPALSGDQFLVVATTEGMLYAINTATGAFPSSGTWPVALTEGIPIRSSPTIAADGTIFVGADDGMLYAVGTP